MLGRLHHVGIVVRDLDEAANRWSGTFGLSVVGRFSVPEEGVEIVLLATPGAAPADTRIELISPLDPDDLSRPVARRLSAKGEGMYHLAFDADEAITVAALANGGLVDPIPSVPSAPVYEQRWVIRPREANGVLLEILGPPPATRNP